MGKIKIKAILKSKKENHIYEGIGIKNNNIITYKDNDIITKIIIDNIITIERKYDYILKIKLKEGINLKGTYITKYGDFDVDTFAENIEIDKNLLKIRYKLKIDKETIDTFEYILNYSIDTD